MTESIDLVNGILMSYKDFVDNPNNHNSPKIEEIERKIKALDDILKENAEMRQQLQPLSADLGGFDDLPPELLSELQTNVSKSEDLDNQIVVVINDLGGQAELSQILVGLYRKFGLVKKRKYIVNKLWRMSKKGHAFSVVGRTGVYTTTNPSEKDGFPDQEGDWGDYNPLTDIQARQALGINNTKPTVPKDVDELEDEIPF